MFRSSLGLASSKLAAPHTIPLRVKKEFAPEMLKGWTNVSTEWLIEHVLETTSIYTTDRASAIAVLRGVKA